MLGASSVELINPITGIGSCCARAASGHTATPPSPAMKSRRRISHASEPLYGQQPTATTGTASCLGAKFLRYLFAMHEAASGPQRRSLQCAHMAAFRGQAAPSVTTGHREPAVCGILRRG